MKLWTIQPPEVLNIINKTGEFACDPSLSENYVDFKNAYEWITHKMNEKNVVCIGTKPTLPLWAWHTYDWKNSCPDLDLVGRTDRPNLCIEFEMPDNQVLLSDFTAWHDVLNNWYSDNGMSEAEWLENQTAYAKLSPAEKEQTKIESWNKVFDISPFENKWITRGRFVQATFWKLTKDMIISTEEFISKEY